MDERRKQTWWNSIRFESEFKKRQLMRVVGFSAVYVGMSTLVMAAVYNSVLEPLRFGELPLFMCVEEVRRAGAIPGMTEMVTLWATLMTGLSIFYACVVGLFFSHKLAGPIYRFKLELQRIVDGKDYRKVSLRDGDDFQDVADSLNRALDEVSQRENVLREAMGLTRDHLDAVVDAVREHGPDSLQLRDAMAQIEAARPAH